jgi:hypothetical protein
MSSSILKYLLIFLPNPDILWNKEWLLGKNYFKYCTYFENTVGILVRKHAPEVDNSVTISDNL